MNRPFLAPVLFLFATLPLFAQSNQLVDRMLGDENADLADSAYMVLVSAGMIDETAPPAEALSRARAEGWLPQGSDGGDPITFGRLAYMIMEAHGEAGGVMYRVFPGPRYAAREAAFQGWSVDRFGADEEISGEAALRLLGNYLAAEEEE